METQCIVFIWTGNLIRRSVFRKRWPVELRGSLLEGKKDHLFHQARSDLAKQELHVESLKKCIGELQRQMEEQKLALQDAQYGFVESRREQVRLQEELSMEEKVLPKPRIRNMHEVGQIQRAQEQRVDEVSVQKLIENHETIQQLTSQLQQMQEQMNSMNDSGDFQDVESNKSGRLSHVSSQPAMIPSSRSLLSRDKRLPFDTCNQSGLQENVFGNQYSTLIHPEIILKEFNLTTCKETEKQSLKPEGRRLVTQGKTNWIKAHFQCRHLQQDRWLRVLQCRWNYRRTTRSDSKDSKYRKCNSTNSILHSRLSCGRCDSKIKWLPVLIFPSDAMLWIKEVEMVDSLDEFVERTFQISRCSTPRLPLLWTRSSRVPSSRRRSASRSRKPKKRTGFYEEDRSPSWSTTTFEWPVLMIQYWITLIYSLLLFMITLFRISIEDGMKFFYCLCQTFHPMVYLGKSVQIENTWVCATQNCTGIVRHGDSSKDISSQRSKVENHGEEEYRSETSITKLLTLGMGELN